MRDDLALYISAVPNYAVPQYPPYAAEGPRWARWEGLRG